MHNAACPYEALQIATDLATMGTKDGSIQPFGYLTLTPNTGIVGSYWNWAYSLIAGANEMLKYSEINTNWDNSTDKALYQAESRFSVLMHTVRWFICMETFLMWTRFKISSELILPVHRRKRLLPTW